MRERRPGKSAERHSISRAGDSDTDHHVASGRSDAPVLTGAPPSLATAAASTLTLPTAPATATLPSAATTITVVLDSGPDAGTDLATGDPQCSVGVIGEDTWSAQYGNFGAGPTDLSTVQLTDEPDSPNGGRARIVSAYLTVGPVFGGRSYTLSLDRFSSGNFVHEIQDNSTTAVIHVAGETIQTPLSPGGIGVDLTVNCPTVNRP